jgi:hypothetical protein
MHHLRNLPPLHRRRAAEDHNEALAGVVVSRNGLITEVSKAVVNDIGPPCDGCFKHRRGGILTPDTVTPDNAIRRGSISLHNTIELRGVLGISWQERGDDLREYLGR